MTLLVGSPTSGPLAGAAYVFRRTGQGGTWLQTQELLASDGSFRDGFGGSLAIDGDNAIIGAPMYAGSHGKAYFFENQAGTWVETQIELPANVQSNGRFGSAVAISGGWAMISSAWESNGGEVHVYEKQAGTWVFSETLLAGDPAEFFGQDVSMDGATALIGASESGAAYFFELQSGSWVESQKVTAPDGSLGEFGYRVDLDGDRAVIGQPDEGSGSAHIFQNEGGTWTQIAHLFEQLGSGPTDRFGNAVSISGDRVAVGGPHVANRGRARVFEVPRFATAFCFCPAGTCANPAEVAGCENSTGVGAALLACGTGSVLLDDISLRGVGLPPGEPCLVFLGGGTVDFAFGDGRRCVGNGFLGLYRLLPTITAGGAGNFVVGPGVGSLAESFGAGPLSAGQTWYAQAFYRDPTGPCSSSFNLTNALEMTLRP